jgi:hypothetical protein
MKNLIAFRFILVADDWGVYEYGGCRFWYGLFLGLPSVKWFLLCVRRKTGVGVILDLQYVLFGTKMQVRFVFPFF